MRTTIPMTIHVPKASLSYACARRAHRVFFSIVLCLCLRIFLRRFLITEPNPSPRACLFERLRFGRESYRKPSRPRPRHTLVGGGDLLHGRARGAPPAHQEVPRKRGPTPPRGVGGTNLPRLDLPAVRRAWFSRPALPARIRWPGGRLFQRGRPVGGDGAGRVRRPRPGPGRAGPEAAPP